MTDNTGTELSKAQESYFRGSCVRDESGKLMRLYHGTTHYGMIKRFNRSKTGYLGPVIYMAARKEDAQEYADRNGEGNGTIYELYANISHPLVVTGSNPVPDIFFAAYGRNDVYEARKEKQSSEPYLLEPRDIRRLQTKGYDGIIWTCGKRVEIGVLNANQVKRADNQFPTYSPKSDE